MRHSLAIFLICALLSRVASGGSANAVMDRLIGHHEMADHNVEKFQADTKSDTYNNKLPTARLDAVDRAVAQDVTMKVPIHNVFEGLEQEDEMTWATVDSRRTQRGAHTKQFRGSL